MNSREYYSEIEAAIKECPIVTYFSIDFDEIDANTGYLKARLGLMDGSILHFIEYFEIQKKVVNRLKYKYQWQHENGDLIARWDNVPHHREIDTFPHHMHDKSGAHASKSVDLKRIIDIIMEKIIL